MKEEKEKAHNKQNKRVYEYRDRVVTAEAEE